MKAKRKKLRLLSIEEEAAACRKAFKGSKVGDWVVHLHHGTDCVEQLTEPIENRIAYILAHKPEGERAVRLRFMRPVSKKKAADYDAKRAPLYADYRAKSATLDADYKAKSATLHLEFCVPDCPWNGETLFPEEP